MVVVFRSGVSALLLAQMRPDWSRVPSRAMITGVLTRQGDRQGGEGDGSRATAGLRSAETTTTHWEGARKGASLPASEGVWPADTLVLDLPLAEL